jgi:uncharacterized protein (DUF1810 family)
MIRSRWLVLDRRSRRPGLWSAPRSRSSRHGMMTTVPHHPPTDPFDLARFVAAQEHVFASVRRELAAGRKSTHWMWFVFPQAHGLGWSAMSERYAVRSLDEARAFLDHPILGRRLRECVDLLLRVPQGRTAKQVLGEPDDLKLRSSMTLFALASAEGAPFERVLERYFAGASDPVTVEIVRRWAGGEQRGG